MSFIFHFTHCSELIEFPTFDTVAPQWALASYSCLFGNAVSASSIVFNEISWTLQVDGNDEQSNQKLNIDRIYTYPQVKTNESKYEIKFSSILSNTSNE